MKILVTGANGQLGNEFRDLHQHYPEHEFLFVGRTELDINNEEEVQKLYTYFKPNFCINCAAYTAVDKAETDYEQAIAINATATGYLAQACKEHSSKFIHISTDYVFDGQGTEPYRETASTNPVNAYGRTKLEGELITLKHNPEAVIIRTSWVYSTHGNNFVKTMIRLMGSRPEIGVVADQQGSPTYAADLATAIMQIIKSESWHRGIYHYSNEGIISWYQFAEEIKKRINSDCKINPLTTEQYPTPAKRPSYSGMSKEKIKATYQINICTWQDALQRCLKKLNN